MWTFFISILAAASTVAAAGSNLKPKLEAGVALGAFYLPDYPGAEESRARYLGLPYAIYRGDFLRVDREDGSRLRFLRRDYIEFDLSFGAGFPAHSEDNDARSGMDDIDWIGEVGPRATIHLYRRPLVRLDLSLPVRYVFSTDFHAINARGWVFNPELKFRHQALFDRNTAFYFNTGPTWATEKMQDYFYQVDGTYARPDRPAFDAKGGYFGWNAGFSVVRTFPAGVALFAGVSQNYYEGAENRNSALLKDNVTESYFAGLAWVFYTLGTEDRNE